MEFSRAFPAAPLQRRHEAVDGGVERARHRGGDVRIDGRRRGALVAEEFLNRAPRQLQRSLGRRRVEDGRPLWSEQKFLDAIRMKEIVQREVAKHDEHRIGPVFSVLGRALPVRVSKCLEA